MFAITSLDTPFLHSITIHYSGIGVCDRLMSAVITCSPDVGALYIYALVRLATPPPGPAAPSNSTTYPRSNMSLAFAPSLPLSTPSLSHSLSQPPSSLPSAPRASLRALHALPPPPILNIPSPSSLTLPPSSELLILKVSASYCRACAGAAPRFAKSARSRADDVRAVYAQMDYPSNEHFCRHVVGIKNLPFFGLFKRNERGDGVHMVVGKSLSWDRMRVLDEMVDNLLGGDA